MKHSDAKPKNRLHLEKSPYLLQHQTNPVDWYPWGPEAFEKAKKEDKLIFLSIGYSTCHWCHVMETESFESPVIADLMNEHFVSIKVDREERPDLDQVYMQAVQALTGSGGWPLTVFLTPDAIPVTGGTYFPPEDRWGRAGMVTLLPRLATMWKEKREDLLRAGTQMAEFLQSKSSNKKAKEPLNLEVFHRAFEQFQSHFDSHDGGFGDAPKFPRSHDLSFLLRYDHRFKKIEALQMVEKTLKQMAYGGIYDHLGGGFARYSTDEKWLIPHFEKMLYDQALLAKTYVEAFQVTRNPFYEEIARSIFDYVLRDLKHPEGAFLSAEDADSEGEEGKFYAWHAKEILEILGKEEGAVFCEYYGVTSQGNFEHGSSVLHTPEPLEAFVARKGLDRSSFLKLIKGGRKKLFDMREKRIRPHLDDKVLASWNGLMISAMAWGAWVFDDSSLAEAASKAANDVLTKLYQKGKLLRRYRDGESAIPAFQDDYACLALGLLDLYQVTANFQWLETAHLLVQDMIQLFWDETDNGFFYSGSQNENLIARLKEYYDGALPSGNSVAATVLFKLARIVGNAKLEEYARKTLESNAETLAQHPMHFSQLLIALDEAIGPTAEIVFSGSLREGNAKSMLSVLRKRFLPRVSSLYRPLDSQAAERLARLAPFTQDQVAKPETLTAYVCQGSVCHLPVTDVKDLENELKDF